MTPLRRLAYAAGAPLVVGLLRVMWWTYRFQLVDDRPVRDLVAAGKPLILTFWHESVFALGWYLGQLSRLGARVTYLVSPSVDGDFGVRMLDILGSESVRGSATRSGVKAMRGLYRAIARSNGSPVVLPDGPSGPRRDCKPGSILLAQMSGAHIVPMACGSRWALRLRTWDRLHIPLPFSRVTIVIGEPYTISKDVENGDLESHRLGLQSRLDDLERRVAELVSGGHG